MCKMINTNISNIITKQRSKNVNVATQNNKRQIHVHFDKTKKKSMIIINTEGQHAFQIKKSIHLSLLSSTTVGF